MATPPPVDSGLFFAEDLPAGRHFELGSRTLTAEEIIAYATEWDPMPFHLDEEAARASPFGGLVASGLHTIAVTVRLAQAVMGRVAVIAGRGMRDVRMLKPLRPGMLVHGTVDVVGCDLRDDGTAVTIWDIRLVDEEGDAVLTILSEAKIWQRPQAGTSSPR